MINVTTTLESEPPACCPQYALLREAVDHNDPYKAERLLSSTISQYRQIREKIEDHKRTQIESMAWALFLIVGIMTILAVGMQQMML